MTRQRPRVVDERSRLGDGEMGTFIGCPSWPVLVTMVERVIRYALIAMAASKEAIAVGEAILSPVYPYPETVLAMTHDNGKEFAYHVLIVDLLGANAYFACRYHSWELGLSEKTNVVTHQYFPKDSWFEDLRDEEVSLVQNKFNSRPRERSDYATPNYIFTAPLRLCWPLETALRNKKLRIF